ncbi:frataxin [Nematocida sp. ERTm5]|nr:frataxin [Nematocida sp. ERTm5]
MLLRTYDSLSKSVMKRIYEVIDRTIDNVSLKDNVITIDIPNKGVFILNRQPTKEEIWLSSPISGPYHFRQNGDIWSDRQGNNLLKVISKEILNNEYLLE